MQLNLPILEQLHDSHNILIAGAGGGFDVFSGLPLYFTLRAIGKNVHLANYSFTEFSLAQVVSEPQSLVDNLVLGTKGPVKIPYMYYPEGYLTQWFQEKHGEGVPVWMLARVGVAPLKQAYAQLVKHLAIDAIILVDGGVDSIMRGDEMGSGTLVEDSISLAAIAPLDVPVKILACIGFGTEVEEGVCHYNALENMAGLMKAGGFLGGCALTPQMEAFQQFEAACRYVWEQPDHAKSHISTRIVPAVNGEFGNFHLYSEDRTTVCISPLMGLYWFFDAGVVISRNRLIEYLQDTRTSAEAIMICSSFKKRVAQRPRRSLPY